MKQKPNHYATFGAFLEAARTQSGLSYRQLAATSGVPHPTIQRLINNEVREPSPNHLVHLAEALDISTSDLFVAAGLPLPQGTPSVEALLRAEYDLSEEGLAEARRQIAAIAERERQRREQSNKKEERL